MPTPRHLFLICIALCTFITTPATAQEIVEPTETQLDLNQQGVDAIGEDDYMRAARLFRASLDLGELNITYVNLGRAFQYAGKCEQAEKNYVAALEAPSVPNPPPDELAEIVQGYRRELRETCHGVLVIECSPSDIELYLDGEGPKTCDAVPIELEKGNYAVRGELGEQATETTVSVTPMSTSRVKLSLSEPPEVVQTEKAADLPPSGTDITPPDSSASANTEASGGGRSGAALWLVGSGLSLAGGVAMDTIPGSSRDYQLEAVDFVPVGLYVAGTGALVYGIIKMTR